MIKSINNALKRTTSSGKVLAELDGLRALAIIMVIYFHLSGFLLHHDSNIHMMIPSWLYSILHNGDNGVPVFFGISSFILGLPFAKHYLFNAKKVNLKKYIIRRITRLQPPYFIILFLFGTYYLITNKYDLTTLLQSFTASNLYSHNIIFGAGSFINYVAWSLEIEFQFYLILPLLAYIFKLPGLYRKIILITGILSGVYIQGIIERIPFTSLLNYYHFFLTGLLVLDLYLTYPKLLTDKSIYSIILGFIALFIVISQSTSNPVSSYFIPFSSGLLLLLALKNPFWNKIFRNEFLSKTGTMSYSMYLIHFQIIALIGIPVVYLINKTHYPSLLILGILLILITIWVISAITFTLIEKPFMNPNWYKFKNIKK